MDVEVLKFEEAEPATYPDLIAIDQDGAQDTIKPEPHIWQRIEDHISGRWIARQCVWTVQGPGDWRPHLTPVSNVTVDQWDDTTKTWSSVIADPTPIGGFYLPRSCVYRINCTVGDTQDAVPQALVEAYQRLRAYALEAQASSVPAGASSHSLKLGDGIDESIDRSPTYLAKAMQYSGAGDLLRNYRRV